MSRHKKIKIKIPTCPECGADMDQDNDTEWSCPTCVYHRAYVDEDGRLNYFTDWDLYDDMVKPAMTLDNRPPVCTGCGSDNWPECQYACELFDD